jgi:hypothetical protein
MAERESSSDAPEGEEKDRRSESRATPKHPLLIKTSLRSLHGKAQLFPSDISTIQQALMDLADNMSELRGRLDALEAMASNAGSARHAAATPSPAEVATEA